MSWGRSPRHFPFVAGVRLFLMAAWTLFMIPIHGSMVLLGLSVSAYTLRFYWKGICRAAGIRVNVHGTPTGIAPVLFVANHISYLDIAVLGQTLLASFVAKSEVGTWPVVGWLSKLGRSVFIVRRRGESATQRDTLMERLERGDSLIIFPEGTSGDGTHILPFKSALFSVAQLKVDGKPLMVQPVSLAYTRLDGLPIGYEWRPYFAWYGDMELGSHVWSMLGLGGALDVTLVFHPPVSMEEFSSRKEMAEHCREVIVSAFSKANAGRLEEDGEGYEDVKQGKSG